MSYSQIKILKAPDVAQVSAAAHRIHSLRHTGNEDRYTTSNRFWTKNHLKLPESVFWKGADIEFDNVWFTYPSRNFPVLRGVSLKICHGQFAAIVGSSGSGKTTIISLLEIFYKPGRGKIRYNGEDMTTLPLGVLRGRMSLVAQEPCLFRGTIRENILLGMETDAIDENRFQQACHDSGLDEFVTSLPEGYNTNIGTAGILLSGGQKQRISIARAMIRNPAVLLLDEATSSLDSQSERQVQAVLERSGQGRTMVVVAHRLSTVQKASTLR